MTLNILDNSFATAALYAESGAESVSNEPKNRRLFPVFLDLAGKVVLVVGAGVVAKRKIEALLDTGASILVVAPELDLALQNWLQQGRIQFRRKSYEIFDLTDASLIIAATNQPAVNRQVYLDAKARNIWVNAVDDSAHSSFQSPARVQRGPLQIAISSGGIAPMLARHVREKLETLFDDSYAALAHLLEGANAHIRTRIPNTQLRRQFFEEALNGELIHTLRSRRRQAAGDILAALIEKWHTRLQTSKDDSGKPKMGRVALVGAGSGDAGLLTLRALRVLNLADVILTDQLVSADVLAMARRDAEVIHVGKRGGGACTEQAAIHALMLEQVQRGKFVVRLKGGDAFVFGRGGEELEFLHAHNVRFEVVPGITAALACAAYSGIPLTHRDLAQSVRFVTAHCRQSIDSLDWAALAQERQTLVVYMGVSRLAIFQQQLQRHGRAHDTPVAIVENGGRPNQRVLRTELGEMCADAAEYDVRAPALLIIGDVARLSDSLHWFGAAVLGSRAKVRAPLAARVESLS